MGRNVWPDLLAQFGSEAGCRRYVIRLGCAPSGGVDTAAISLRKKKSRSRGTKMTIGSVYSHEW